MNLYLYNRESKDILLELDNVASYTDREVFTEEGVYGPLSENCELSRTADCAETLRADWRRDHPSAETRLEELEALMAALLFGGETV